MTCHELHIVHSFPPAVLDTTEEQTDTLSDMGPNLTMILKSLRMYALW
jgi:hypothetical protein